MVSALWIACAENDVERLPALLSESSVDLEAKDADGETPLIQAVKNGHVDVVRMLLDKGADPLNPSTQGAPATQTTNPAILQLLAQAAAARGMSSGPTNSESVSAPAQQQLQNGHHNPNGTFDPSQIPNGDHHQQPPAGAVPYWAPPPPGMYGYYPPMAHGLPPPPPTGPDGAPLAYYPPPPGAEAHAFAAHNAPGNLPPPEVARLIPCRFFPACRYGASCMFAHPAPQQALPPPPPHGPPAGAYYPPAPGPPPHVPYGLPYDPAMVSPPPPFSPAGYYPISPQAFVPPPPPQHMGEQHPGGPVSPPGAYPPPPPPGAYATSPLSPSYSVGGVPPVSQQPMPHPAQSPQQPMFAPSLPTQGHEPPFVVQPPQQQQQPSPQAEQGNGPTPAGPPEGGYTAPPVAATNSAPAGPREGLGHHRRGSARRSSFSRKPPCIFFPTGRCRNGEDCRFPHILPNENGPVGNHPHPGGFAGGRGGHRSRFSVSQGAQAAGFATIDEKMGDLSIRDQSAPPSRPNGVPPFSRGGGPNGFAGARADHNKRAGAPPPQPMKQRLPGADDFPSLVGSSAPSPARSPSIHGPTAAQVLQAPAPKKEFRDAAPMTNGDGAAIANSVNGTATNGTSAPNGVEKDAVSTPATNGAPASGALPPKLPVSFAAIATSAVSAASEAPSQVSVSA